MESVLDVFSITCGSWKVYCYIHDFRVFDIFSVVNELEYQSTGSVSVQNFENSAICGMIHIIGPAQAWQQHFESGAVLKIFLKEMTRFFKKHNLSDLNLPQKSLW